MKTYSHLVASDVTRQLVDAGFLAGDAQEAATTHPTHPEILIRQVDGLVENSAFDLDCGYGTGYILSLHIAVDLPVFSIWDWRLDPPWEDPLIQWLPEPSGGVYPKNMYQFPGRLEFPRDEVINHWRKVQRGHSLDGLLLGRSFKSIPDTYKHGANIDASLVLINEMGREFSTPVQLWVNRIARIDQKPMKRTRPPLFSRSKKWRTKLAPAISGRRLRRARLHHAKGSVCSSAGSAR